MNFLAHFYMDSDSADSLFIIGLVTPDLVSLFDRNIKFRQRDVMRNIKGKNLSMGTNSLLLGVNRHFEADGIFHDSPFFKEESSRIAKKLRESFPQYEVSRSFFVGHVLLELCIDRLLMKWNPGLVHAFYHHFRSQNLDAVVAHTEVLAGQSLPGYHDFLKRFVENPYIPQYEEVEFIKRIMKRILSMVRIPKAGYRYLYDEDFNASLVSCEASLGQRFIAGLESIRKQLRVIEYVSVR
jgi:hypothetical protein